MLYKNIEAGNFLKLAAILKQMDIQITSNIQRISDSMVMNIEPKQIFRRSDKKSIYQKRPSIHLWVLDIFHGASLLML